MLGRIPHDTGARRDREIVAEALAAVDGAYLASREYTHLSGGERQRVHLARVLAQVWEAGEGASRYLILDEPTDGLDVPGRREVLRLIREQAAAGRTVILSSHIMGEVEKVVDRAGVVARGKLVAEGTLAEITAQAGHDDLDDAFIALVGEDDAS